MSKDKTVLLWAKEHWYIADQLLLAGDEREPFLVAECCDGATADQIAREHNCHKELVELAKMTEAVTPHEFSCMARIKRTECDCRVKKIEALIARAEGGEQ